MLIAYHTGVSNTYYQSPSCTLERGSFISSYFLPMKDSTLLGVRVNRLIPKVLSSANDALSLLSEDS